jgi:hypothetical protein
VGFPRYALAATASVLLAGCGGSQTPIGAPSAMPQSPAIATHAAHGKSWMLPEASSSDLLYVSSANGGNVYVFTYPDRVPAGTLANLNTYATGECVDRAGDIFITTSNQSQVGTIYEYAHGGTTPIAALNDPGQPYGCAVDPLTGNLAVGNNYDTSNPYNTNYGDVAVYAGAQGSPTMYYSSQFPSFYFCGYDNKGNLYASVADEYAVGPQLARLSRGSTTFSLITIAATKLYFGYLFAPSVQWDGKRITVSSHSSTPNGPVSVYRLRISGTSATVVGTTELKSINNRHEGQSWIQGGTIIGIDNKAGTDVAFWRYPQGGLARHTLKKVGSDLLWGVTVSLAP